VTNAALALAFACFAVGCVGKVPTGSGDARAASDVQVRSDVDVNTLPPATSCLEIRSCVQFCKADSACAMRCVAQAPATAQTRYKAAEACSRRACPKQDMDCRCGAECIFPGECTEVVDDCTNGAEDRFCQLCL